MATTSTGRRSRHASSSNKRGGRHTETNQIYAYPLPLIFCDTYPDSRINSVLGLLGLSLTSVINPHCEGVFDPATRSVWVVNAKDSMILWRRGFFGKGNLSRSEPSWLARQKKVVVDGKVLTSEEITAKRRAERKQFKLDRAKAIAEAAAAAEAAFAEGRVLTPSLSAPSIPSAATWKPSPLASGSGAIDAPTPAERDAAENEDLQENIEHLQLTLQEAFFLSWNLDCLTILDPQTREPMSLSRIWHSFRSVLRIPTTPDISPLQLDNPFLIHYVVYHHYRSLGWVVKGGIKFCVDYLLYKRGPVFSHAEFAIVVCPVYEDPEDQTAGSLDASPFTWSWLSTINRVNTQVQKTLILVYVTIPARSRLSPDILSSPACFAHYSVREVTLRRFIPARMRD